MLRSHCHLEKVPQQLLGSHWAIERSTRICSGANVRPKQNQGCASARPTILVYMFTDVFGNGAYIYAVLLGSRMLKTVPNGRNPLTKWLRGDVQIDSYLLTFSLFSVGGSRNPWRHDVNRNAEMQKCSRFVVFVINVFLEVHK